MKKLEAIAKQVVRDSLKKGAKEAGANIVRNRFIELVQRDGKLERVRESSSSSLTLSVYATGRYSQHSTSDLRPIALGSFVDQALEVTKVLEPDEHRHLLDPKYYAGRHEGGWTFATRVTRASTPTSGPPWCERWRPRASAQGGRSSRSARATRTS